METPFLIETSPAGLGLNNPAGIFFLEDGSGPASKGDACSPGR
jgi:hypothetical protein